MRTARQVVEQIASGRDALYRDPTRSGPSVAVELRRVVPPVAERAATALDAAAARLRRTVGELEAGMAPGAPMTPEALQLSGELRSILAKMSPADRSKTLTDAIAAGDEAMASAVLRAPALLSGLSPDVHTAMRHRWQEARHPEAAARVARLGHALAAIETAGGATVAFVQAIINTPGAEAYEAAAGAADAALKAAREAAE